MWSITFLISSLPAASVHLEPAILRTLYHPHFQPVHGNGKASKHIDNHTSPNKGVWVHSGKKWLDLTSNLLHHRQQNVLTGAYGSWFLMNWYLKSMTGQQVIVWDTIVYKWQTTNPDYYRLERGQQIITEMVRCQYNGCVLFLLEDKALHQRKKGPWK